MRLLIASICALLGTTAMTTIANAGAIRYVGVQQIGEKAVIVDTRARERCQQQSIAGAHCLPASDLVGPAGELADFADIFWALGTAGLDGSETVLIAGDRTEARDFIAGVLYLCGQANIEILTPAIDKVLQTGKLRSGHGEPRAILRQRIYRATMRDAMMVLPGELKHLQRRHPRIRFLDASRLKRELSPTSDQNKTRLHKIRQHEWQVIYAPSVRQGIAWFTRLMARRDFVNKRIQVVPVAMATVRAQLDRAAFQVAPIVLIADITIRGEHKWS